MKAAAYYLRKLREQNVGSRQKLKELMNLTDDSNFERIEGGKETKFLSYFAYIKAVGGRADHVAALLTSDDGPAAMAVADIFLDELSDGGDISTETRTTRRRQVLAIAEQLFSHPVEFGRWLGYAEHLLDGLGGKS